MNKKVLISLTSILIVCNSVLTTHVTAATPEESIEKGTIQIQQLDNQIIDLNSEISSLNSEISQLNIKLLENKSEINKTEDKIKNTEVEITKSKKVLEEKQEVLGKRLSVMYKSNLSSNPLFVILSSDNFSDAISNAQAVIKVISLDKKLISDIEKEKAALDLDVNNLNNKKDELKTLESSTQESLKDINTKKESQQIALDKLSAEKKKAASIIEENENSLISHSVSVIKSSSSSESEIKDAISTLRSLFPQLNTSSVKNKAQDAINDGTSSLRSMKETASNKVSNTNIGSIDRGSSPAKKTYTMEATAYFDGLLTASGLKPIRNASGLSTVAVDPSVIPLGSKLYIEGYGYAIAADTGSAIKNLKIDLYMNSKAECSAFGRRNVTVSLMAYPNEW
ncbi:3D domain-containing protein [Clostridium algidicarnis]|uniref:3D domain-containing protein n=1 Tax=Clostridium algidicarnis TaxID=37659 RepID=UPI003FD89534